MAVQYIYRENCIAFIFLFRASVNQHSLNCSLRRG